MLFVLGPSESGRKFLLNNHSINGNGVERKQKVNDNNNTLMMASNEK